MLSFVLNSFYTQCGHGGGAKSMDDLLIHGTGSMGRLLFSEILEYKSFNVKAFVCDDKYYKNDDFMGVPVYKVSEVEKFFPASSIPVISTGSYSSLRERYNSYLQMKSKGYRFINFISKNAIVAKDLIIGENNLIFSGVYLDYFGKLGNCNIIRPQTYVGHNFDIGNGVYIAPNCSIAGFCTIEDLSFIGIGSTILERLTIKRETLVGAASLVTKSTEPYTQYIDSPAKKVKTHEQTGVLL